MPPNPEVTERRTLSIVVPKPRLKEDRWVSREVTSLARVAHHTHLRISNKRRSVKTD
jgi:hypothetical protein